MLGMTTMAKAHRDDAGRAVQTAILALAMSRQVTKDRLVLVQIVLAALLLDTGRARLRGRIGDRFLSEKEERLVVPAAAFNRSTSFWLSAVKKPYSSRKLTMSMTLTAPANGDLSSPLNSKVPYTFRFTDRL